MLLFVLASVCVRPLVAIKQLLHGLLSDWTPLFQVGETQLLLRAKIKLVFFINIIILYVWLIRRYRSILARIETILFILYLIIYMQTSSLVWFIVITVVLEIL